MFGVETCVCKMIFSVLKVEEKVDGTPKRVAGVLMVPRKGIQ